MNSVKNLLQAVGIGTVIVVDEEFRPQFEDLLAAAQAVGDRQIKVADIGVVDFSQERELWESTLRDAWHKLAFAQRQQAFEDLCEQTTLLPAPDELSLFNELSPDINYRGMTPEEWDTEMNAVVASGAETPTLVLFDRDFGAGDENAGLRCAVELYNADADGSIWAGLLTNTVQVGEEGSAWDEFKIQLRGNASRLILLSKKHLVGNASSFAEALRVVLMSQPASILSGRVKDEIVSSAETAAGEMHSLIPPEFERIVFRLARDEGIWEVDVLLRLFEVSLRSDVRNALHNTDTVREAIRRLRALDALRGNKSNPVSIQAQCIYRNEVYENPDHLHRLYLPVELGDIFQKEDGQKKFVLVGQPCDLMVREDGRRAPAISFVTLLRISLTDPNKEITGSYTPRGVFQLPAFDGGNSAWVELDRSYPVPVESVDYCALNDNGQSLAPGLDDPPDWILPSWKQRWSVLAQEADTLRQKLATLANNNTRIAQVKAHFGVRRDCTARPSMQGANFKLGLVRTGRILPPYARALLTSYSAHLARDAFEPAIA